MRPDTFHRHRIERITDESLRRDRIQRMTTALESAFQIPQGAHLVAVLGDGSERCNRDALLTWVSREIERLEMRFSEQQVSLLAEALHRKLTIGNLDRGRA